MGVLFAQIVVVFINTYIAFTENKKRIYVVTFLFNLSNLVMYLINKDKTTAIIYIVITVRSLVYVFKDTLVEKWGKWSIVVPILSIALQLAIGLYQMENLWQLIPALTPCYVCYYLWFYNTTQKLRVGNIVGNSMWFIYNTATGLYIVAISRLITVAVNAAAFVSKRKTGNC